MGNSASSNRLGDAPNVGAKAPVKVATLVPITRQGFQTVNGVPVVLGDRVLDISDPDLTLRGIYVVAAGTWTRATDWNKDDDITSGVMIPSQNRIHQVQFTGDHTIGVTQYTFVLLDNPTQLRDDLANPAAGFGADLSNLTVESISTSVGEILRGAALVSVEAVGSVTGDASATFVVAASAAASGGFKIQANGTYTLNSLPDTFDWTVFEGKGNVTINGIPFEISYIAKPRLGYGQIKARIAAGQATKIAVYSNSVAAGFNTTGYVAPTESAGDAIAGPDGRASPNGLTTAFSNVFPAFGLGVLVSTYPTIYNTSYPGKSLATNWFDRNFERAVINKTGVGVVDCVIVGDSINATYLPSFPVDTAVLYANLNRLRAKIQGYGATMIVYEDIHPIAQAGFDFRQQVSMVEETKRQFCKDFGIEYWDIGSEFQKLLNVNNDLGAIATVPVTSPALTQIGIFSADPVHPSDAGHRILGQQFARRLLPFVIEVPAEGIRFIGTGDYDWYNQVAIAGAGIANTAPFQTQQGGLRYIAASNYNNQAWLQARFWNVHRNQQLVYRGGGADGEKAGALFVPRANAAQLLVRSGTTGDVLFQAAPPNDGVKGFGNISGVDRPHLICPLSIGLCAVDLFPPTDTTFNFFPGGIQVLPGAAQSMINFTESGIRDKTVANSRNLLQETGRLYSKSSIVNAAQGESDKGCNWVSFGEGLLKTSIFLLAEINTDTGIGLICGPARSGVFPTYSGLRGNNLYLYRNSGTDLRLIMGTVDYSFTRAFTTTLLAGAYNLTGPQPLQIDFWRDATGKQRIQVFDGWETGVSVINFTSDDATAVGASDWAGYFGDLYSTGNVVDVQSASLIKRIA